MITQPRKRLDKNVDHGNTSVKQMSLVSNKLFNMGFFILLVLLMSGSSFGQSTCDSIYIGDGSFYSCDTNKCSLHRSATFIVSSEGSKLCANIYSSAEDQNPVNIEINVQGMYYDYPLVNCYSTGDPTISFQSYCACSGNPVVDCSNCPSVPLVNQPSFCDAGISRGTGCLLSSFEATWCTVASVDSVQDYSVCELASPDYFALISVIIDGQQYNVTFTPGNNAFSAGNYNISLLTETFSSALQDKMFVLDNNNPANFWITPKHTTNAISEYNMDKVGWAKTDNDNYITALKDRSVTVPVKCSTDEFTHNAAVMSFKDLLKDSTYIASRQYPGSLYTGSMCPANFISYNDGSYSPINSPLGVTCTDTPSGYPVSFGITLDGITLSGMPITDITGTFGGPLTLTSFAGTSIGAVRCSFPATVTNVNGDTVQQIQCTNKQIGPYTPGSVGLCWKNVTAAGSWVCDSTLTCRTFPSGLLSTYVFADSQKIQISSEPSSEMFPTSFYVPFLYKSLKVNIEGVFDTVYLTENNMLPEILSVTESDGIITLSARSYQGKGTCMVSTNPHVTEDILVNLDFQPGNYILPTTVKKFDGSIVITLQCAKKNDRVKLKLSIERSDINIAENSISDENIRDLSEESSFKNTISTAGSIGNFFWSGLSSIFGENLFSRFLYWTIVILMIIVIAGVGLYIVMLLFGLIYYRIILRIAMWFKPTMLMNEQPQTKTKYKFL